MLSILTVFQTTPKIPSLALTLSLINVALVQNIICILSKVALDEFLAKI